MVREIKVRQVGGSVGATIPKEMAERLHVAAGDTLFAVETEEGMFLGLNGLDFEADEEDVVATIRGVAAGEASEEELTRWTRLRSRPRSRESGVG